MLTRKQLELLDFIRQRVAAEGVPPSFDEMKDALDLKSKSGIHRLITALEERGFIRRLAHRARALEIVKLPEAMEKPGYQPATFTPRVILGSKPDPAPRRPAAALDIDPVDAMDIPMMGASPPVSRSRRFPMSRITSRCRARFSRVAARITRLRSRATA